MANLAKKTVSAAKTEAMMLASFLQAIAGEEKFFKQCYELKVYVEGNYTHERVMIATDAPNVIECLKKDFDEMMYAKFNRHVSLDGMRINIYGIEENEVDIA